jgi:transglutaminase-like putative cysteine protease
MSILEVLHRTHFSYGAEIPTSYNEARLLPAFLPRQRVLSAEVEISPLTWQTQYFDYWETRVIAFEVLRPHRELTVTATSTVEVIPDRSEVREAADWDAILGPKLQDLLTEYLFNSPTTLPSDELADFAHEAAGHNGPDEAARLICAYLHETVQYIPGVTTVHTPATQAWKSRSGVCQDFAHLAVGALRTVGIPARYVSGYLHPRPEAEVGETVRGESHAWIEWWAGAWRGFDPTNASDAGDHHVVVARAREYRDVMPLAGVFSGAESTLDVKVEVTRRS